MTGPKKGGGVAVMDITMSVGDLDSHALEALLGVDRIAWDIETTGLDWRVDRIGTCQLSALGLGTFLVALDGRYPKNLVELLADPTVLKVFHHAPFDLRFMSHHWSVRPANIKCSKVASRLLGPKLPASDHSLKSLLAKYLDVELDKSERLSDWTSGSLSMSQMAYAANDVRYLLPLLELLEKDLAAAGLLDLYVECCSFLPARVRLETGGWPDVFAY